MSADLGEREYLDIRTEVGFWYVSNPNLTLRGIGSKPGKSLRACIIGGRFITRAQAQAWLDAQSGNHLESIVWQQEPA